MEAHDELNRTLGEILGEIRGVNLRLDRTNGRLDKHDDKIDHLEAFKDQATGKLAMMSAGITFFIGIVGVGINKMLWN